MTAAAEDNTMRHGTGRRKLVLRSAPPGFPAMIDAVRTLQDRIAEAAPPDDLVAEVTQTLNALSDRLARHAVGEDAQLAGRLADLPGRGQALIPVVQFDQHDDRHVRGRVVLGRFYLGGNGAAHGGAVPLVFDDVLGRLANAGDRPVSRTAYLRVDYRNITPIETELEVEAHVDRVDGRKRYVTGVLRHGRTVCAEAEGLFVELLPGQP